MLQISTDQTDDHGKEQLEYGTREFPIAFFYDDLNIVTVPWHWHEEFELSYLVRGKLQIRAGGACFAVSGGEAYFFNSSVLHMAEPLEKDTIQKTCVFHARLIASEDSIIYQKYLLPLISRSDLPVCVIRPDSTESRKCIHLIEQAWDAGAANAKHHEITVRKNLTDVLIHLLEDAPASVSDSHSERSHKEELRLRQMLTFIETHYMDSISLEDIADSAHISISECLRCFHSLNNSTPMQYVMETRLSKSRDLLITTDLKITEIAGLCGVQDAGYFTRIFRKTYGLTPVQYRKKHS
jgi:AraC-like DNA-binding protein